MKSRAEPPKHSPAASSSSEQVLSKALIDSMRLWKSLMCSTCSVKAWPAPPRRARAAGERATDEAAWRDLLGGIGIARSMPAAPLPGKGGRLTLVAPVA